MRKYQIIVAAVVMTAGILAGCGEQAAKSGADTVPDTAAESQAEKQADEGVTTIKIGCNVTVSGVQSYLDDNDELKGSDVDILKAIDEKLPDVQFEYVATSFDDVFVGLESGAYQGGIANCFLTRDRIEKYAIPSENIGASYIGLLVKKEHTDLTSLEDVANQQKENGLTFYSMQAGNGLTYIVDVYNEEHPDNPVVFEYTSENTNNDVLSWIPNGRYDVGLALASTWQQNFEAEDGAYHEFLDEMAWIPLQTVGTYPLFNKEKIPDGFLEEFDAALKSLKEDGTAGKITEDYFGYDVFEADIKNLAQ